MKDKELITLLQTPGTKAILEAALTSYAQLVEMVRDELVEFEL